MSEKKEYTPFQRALVDAVLEKYEEVPKEAALSYEFSPEFEQFVEDVVNGRSPKKESRYKGKRVLIRIVKVAIITAIIIALLAGTAMAIPAIREAIIDFFTTEHEHRISISFDPEKAATAPNTIETAFAIYDLPDGYTLVFENISDSSALFWWTNEEDQLISFTQWVIPEDAKDDSWLGLNAADHEQQTVHIDNYVVKIITTPENKKYIWTNNFYFFVLEVPNDLSQEDIDNIFISWCPVP